MFRTYLESRREPESVLLGHLMHLVAKHRNCISGEQDSHSLTLATMKLALSLLISLLGLLHAQAATLPAQIPLNAASISKNKTLVPVYAPAPDLSR